MNGFGGSLSEPTRDLLVGGVEADVPADARRAIEASQRIEQLEAAQTRAMALLEAMPDLLFRISRDLTFIDYRDPTRRGLDVQPEDFLGKRLEEFLPQEIVELVEPNLRQALATGETVTYPSHYDYGDGRHTFDNRVVKSGENEVVLICRDTTSETRAVLELERNTARLQKIVEHSREYTVITDAAGRFTFVSAPVERILGYTPDELIGTSFLRLVHPDDLPLAIAVAKELTSISERPPLRLRLLCKGGGTRIIEATSKAQFDDELIGGLLTHCRDISDYVKVQDHLRESLAQLDAIVDTAAEGILTLHISGAVRSLNRAARAMFRCADDDVSELGVSSLLADSARDSVAAAMRRAVLGDDEALRSLPAELECVRTDGSRFTASLSMSIIPRDDGAIFAAIIRDDSERRALERQLEYQATHDALTGLPNRNLFMANLDRALRRAAQDGTPVAVLFLDLDRFKIVNDSLGHAAGDRLLCAVATRLTSAVRGEANVARFGGDEFLVLCTGLREVTDVRTIVARVLDALRTSFDIGVHEAEEVFVTASAGVAVHSPDGSASDPEILIRNADVALYQAKEHGRDRFEVFDDTRGVRSDNRVAIETALRHAVARQELVVHYQPVKCLTSSAFVGTEALVRWDHNGVLVPPGHFIAIAEESDLIVDIGRWVLLEACRQTAEWRRRFRRDDLSVAVNVSGRQLESTAFPEAVRAVLAETRLEPSALTLEITESRLVHDDDRTLNQLHALRKTGVKVAIDDFGTGYSSLGYLRHLPVNIIKLDRCFTSQLEHDRHTIEIVRTITTLAHTLDMEVVAEGVETEEQLNILRLLSCDKAQGFLLARPMARDALEGLLAEQQAAESQATEQQD